MTALPANSGSIGQGAARSTRTVVWGGVAEAVIQLVTSFGVDLTTEQHVAILGILTFVINFVAVQIEQRSGVGFLRDPELDPTKAPVISPATGVGAGGFNPQGGFSPDAEIPAVDRVVEDESGLVEEPVEADDVDPAVFDHGEAPAMDDDLTHVLSEDEEPVEGGDLTVGDLTGERGAASTRTIAVVALVIAVVLLAVVLL